MHHRARPRPRPTALRRATTWCVLSTFAATLPGAPAFAELAGEKVTHGKATFERDGKNTTITTRTRSTIVDYDRFDIERDESVRIDQPNARSRILNRVSLGDASRIDGSLSSNGIVYILNPAGVFLGDRAVVDVSGLVAGAGHLSNDDFLRGIDRVTDVEGDVGVSVGAVIRSTGDVALIGQHVQNQGAILSRSGQIALVAGNDVVLAPLDGNVLVHVDQGATPPPAADPARFGVEQNGTLDGQRVVLSAGDGYSLAMNHTGVTRAEEIHVQAGPNGLAQIAGTLDASNTLALESGGSIQVGAGKIAVLAADLDASGGAGGGVILLGGDVRGSGAGQKAERLYVAPDAYLRADALVNGNGGRIVAYAKERTGFYGHLSARGGAHGGNGGFAEISGARLDARGKIDLGAPHGRAGTLLYDPEVIEIVGGTLDGNDADDPGSPTTVVDDDGDAGQVLFGSDGEGADFGEHFLVYESEIEGTDANIVLEATNRIFASGNFSNISDSEDAVGIVQLKSGRSLTLRTTGTTAPNPLPADPLGIDLTTSDQGDALTWRVRDGGDITIETNLDAPSANQADIQVGKLESLRAQYEQVENVSVRTPVIDPNDPHPRSISVTAESGDIDIASIAGDGDDADAVLDRSSSPAARVNVHTEQGNVTVGAISVKGGSGTAEDPAVAANRQQGSFGSDGGIVTLGSSAGSVTVNGPVDLSGGDGRGTFLIDEANNVPFVVGGGLGGQLTLDALGPTGNVNLNGNVTAKGGAGVPVLFDGQVLQAPGNAGGKLLIGADHDVNIGAVTVNMSGGDGSFGGGSANGGDPSQATVAIQISGARVDSAEGNVTIGAATLTADGGKSGQQFGSTHVVDGGAGGRGGDIIVRSETGKLDASGMTLNARGGDGVRSLDPLTHQPRIVAGTSAQIVGGSGGTVTVDGKDDVLAGTIASTGGTATNGAGGAGGLVSVFSREKNLEVGAIDLHGGNASKDPASPDTNVALAGGAAGRVDIGHPVLNTDGTPAADGVGNVTIHGSVGGEGGTGQAPDSVNPDDDPDALLDITHARGAIVDVAADPETGVIADDPGARFFGNLVTLEAFRIGSTGARVAVGGTEGKDDSATFSAFGEVHGELQDPANLERAEVEMRKEAAFAEVDSGGNQIVRSTGAAGSTPHTLTKLVTTSTPDTNVTYRLNVTPVPAGDPPVTPPQPDLAITRGAVHLGDAGGEIANGAAGTALVNRGAIKIAAADPGSGAHVTTDSGVVFTALSVGAPGAAIELDGDASGALEYDVAGDIDAAVVGGGGGGGDFGAISIIQHDPATGDVNMNLDGDAENEIRIVSGGTANVPVSRIALADTSVSNSAFGYRVSNSLSNPARLEVDEVRLGGTGRLETTGDIVLTDEPATAITTNGNSLTLDALGIRQESSSTPEIAMAGDPTDPAALVFSGTSFGTAAAPIRTTGMKAVAGALPTSGSGGIFLRNEGSDLRIAHVENRDPEDVSGTGSVFAETGLEATNGDVSVVNTGGRIVLGALNDAPVSGTPLTGNFHVRAKGNVTLDADAIEIENARFLKTVLPVVGTVFTPTNEALIVSSNGNVALGGTQAGAVNTSAASTAHSDEPGAPADQFVHASLTVDAAKGVTTYSGDVGTRDAAGRLALLDTTSAKLTADRQMAVGDARFRGALDGPGGLTITAADLPESTADHAASVQFDGNVGQQGNGLSGLNVNAEKITFTSADRVSTGAGGVTLSTNQTSVPTAATIADTSGGLRIQTQGSVLIGDLDKLSAVGPLSIVAGDTVRVTDLSATELNVDAQHIEVFAREPGQVLQRDGTTTIPDQGTDLVANNIHFGSLPTVVGTGPTPRIGVGSGSLTKPGRLTGFDVVRFTPDAGSVNREMLIADNGQILDLTPEGGTIIGNPTQDLPRERPLTVPELQAQPSDDNPPPEPLITSEQMIAFLHCGTPSDPSPSCDASQLAPLASISSWQDSALATQRATDLAAAYREMRQIDLSAAFERASSGYRAKVGFGEFDAQGFAHYLETSPDAEDARAAIHRFAELLVEIDLLGLSPDATLRVRQQLAGELSAEADVEGFDADAVLTAVAATPIGMPPSQL